MTYIATSEDRIDSRDIVKFLTDLQDELDILIEEGEDGTPDVDSLIDEIGMWEDFLTEAEKYSGDSRTAGISFIAVSDFESYAYEYADGLGIVQGNKYEWPLNKIDWKAAAEELADDFTEIEIDGYSFYFR